jgi:ubiquinone/menaquinone biosynthesis C-methylase UbiE
LSRAHCPTKNVEEHTRKLYITDEYIRKHPSVHKEDSPWKIDKILPMIDTILNSFDKKELTLLDVGGGGGLILGSISTYIERRYCIKVNKLALDLSPGLLEIQKKANPDLRKALNEDIRKTSLADKEVDVTLLIDLLEHVPNPAAALSEVRRISKYAIFKVPLEGSPFCGPINLITWGITKKDMVENLGHINIYDFKALKKQIEDNTGYILDFYFTNVFDYFLTSNYYRRRLNVPGKLINHIAALTFHLSPILCCTIFEDFAMILVKCYSLNENKIDSLKTK